MPMRSNSSMMTNRGADKIWKTLSNKAGFLSALVKSCTFEDTVADKLQTPPDHINDDDGIPYLVGLRLTEEPQPAECTKSEGNSHYQLLLNKEYGSSKANREVVEETEDDENMEGPDVVASEMEVVGDVGEEGQESSSDEGNADDVDDFVAA